MSTTHNLITKRHLSLEIDANGGDYDLCLHNDEADDWDAINGLSAQEALEVAAGIIYAVWTYDPDRANGLINKMRLHQFYDRIPETWNEIVRNRA